MGDKSSSVTVGFKYFLGAHMGLVHGPVDSLNRIRVADKVAWVGALTESGSIVIEQEELFGGDGGEGGIDGTFTFANGDPLQIQSVYLQGNLGTPLPAFRGVTCGIIEQMYISSNNPYLKPWAFLMTRTDVTTLGETQWHVEKASIAGCSLLYTETITSEIEQLGEWCQYLEGYTDTGDCDSPEEDPCSLGAPLAPFGQTEPNSYNGTKESGYAPQFIKRAGRYYYTPDPPAGWSSITTVPGLEESAGIYAAICYALCTETTNLDRPKMAWRRRLLNGNYHKLESFETGDGKSFVCPVGSIPVVWQRQGVEAPGQGGKIYEEVYCVTNPEVLDPEIVETVVQTQDMNPAHIIRECLTDKEWGMGYSAADIDDVSFTAAADTLYAEQMGISILWQRENTIEAFVQDIVRHIDAALYVDRRTGKFVLKLIRSEATPTLTLGPNEIERVENYKRPAFGDLVNSVTVIYDDCDDGKLTGPAA